MAFQSVTNCFRISYKEGIEGVAVEMRSLVGYSPSRFG